ncbi:MAG: PIN domain-containing protein [Patescibacteria group bacterium]
MLIDSNIIINFLNKDQTVFNLFKLLLTQEKSLFISSITIAEVLSFPSMSPTNFDIASTFLKNFISIPFTDQIAIRASYFRRKYRFELPDAAIVATASALKIPLITRDKQFDKVTEVLIKNDIR